jgi:hypothetical protein
MTACVIGADADTSTFGAEMTVVAALETDTDQGEHERIAARAVNSRPTILYRPIGRFSASPFASNVIGPETPW